MYRRRVWDVLILEMLIYIVFLMISKSTWVSPALYNPFTNHNPLSMILSLGEYRPSQSIEGLQSEHQEIVEIIFVSNSNRCVFSDTSNTTNEKYFWILWETSLSTSLCLLIFNSCPYCSFALRVVRSQFHCSRHFFLGIAD